jgi:hypothetical protein
VRQRRISPQAPTSASSRLSPPLRHQDSVYSYWADGSPARLR